jgi:serine beta-lactamase-like protein LACTB
MMLSRRSLMLGTAALAATLEARAAGMPPIDRLRAIAQGMMAADPLPALSVAIVQGNDLVWAEAFGKVDLELEVAARTDHRFRLGSVSKVIATTAAAQLAARGVLDLDHPISTYLPDLPEHHRATTLRQLFTHRGGVRHYANKDFEPDNIDQRVYSSNADILAVFINDPLIAPPGERVSYSTFGYTLASIVMESAAKLPFLELIQREVATPLQLPTLGPDSPLLIVPNRVKGYHPAGVVKRQVPTFDGKWASIPLNNPTYKWAGGGLLSSSVDLARFGAAHLAPGKLSQKALDLLFTVQTEGTDRMPPLGLGWRVDQDGAQRLRWHHAGSQDGARAGLVVYPKENLSIAIATNVTALPGDVNAASEKFADALLA